MILDIISMIMFLVILFVVLLYKFQCATGKSLADLDHNADRSIKIAFLNTINGEPSEKLIIYA